MVELIRDSAVPAGLMRAAAKGALSLPPAEMLEVLVFLAGHPLFGKTAQLTLAGWDAATTLAVVAGPDAPREVLDYFTAPANLRPSLTPTLLEHSAVPLERLLELAGSSSCELLDLMLASPRVRQEPQVLRRLLANTSLTEQQRSLVTRELERLGAILSDAPGTEILEPALSSYLREHAAEISAEDEKPFHLVRASQEEQEEIAMVSAGQAGMNTSLAAARALGTMRIQERGRLSPVQKIARMKVGERVQLAYRGSREERFILIRDGAKIVSSAVLESPKITESEVESFASMRNVGEHVLRIISRKRKFMRRYVIKRLLTANPRCPIDVAMPLVKQLLLADLRYLTMNRDVSDTVRNFAFKMWREKTAARR
jgi:hypothetical protein